MPRYSGSVGELMRWDGGHYSTLSKFEVSRIEFHSNKIST